MAKLRLLILMSLVLVLGFSVYSQSFTPDKETYLLVVDVQGEFITARFQDSIVEDFITSINSLIEQTDPAKVIYVKAGAKALNIGTGGIRVEAYPGPELDSRLKMVNNQIYVKWKGSSFSSGKLMEFLNKQNARKILVTGLMAEKCVYDTVLDGKKRGYEILVLPDAILGESPKSKQKILRKMEKNGVRILS